MYVFVCQHILQSHCWKYSSIVIPVQLAKEKYQIIDQNRHTVCICMTNELITSNKAYIHIFIES
ncbi:MAG: hypothetical protein ACI8RD_004832 [Bacillariaceae sp.]|jgi:hypothetical protein